MLMLQVQTWVTSRFIYLLINHLVEMLTLKSMECFPNPLGYYAPRVPHVDSSWTGRDIVASEMVRF
jgi:hypothetical protein